MTALGAAFDPRRNAIGFLRWFLAFLVIFSHAGPIAGFYGGKDLGTQWSNEQSLGGVAVCGFFFLSGFLISRSKMGRTTTIRYFWHRFLRIYPGWFLALLVTAYIFAPLAWFHEKGTWAGFWDATSESPFTYFSSNVTLVLKQINIAGMGTNLPLYVDHGILDWNGSAWTLAFEFGAYILVAVLGLAGALSNRLVGGVVSACIIALAMMQWLSLGNLAALFPLFGDFRALLLLAPFAWGVLFNLYKDKIPIDDRLAAACALIAAYTYAKGGWLVFGQYAFCYFLIWFAVRVPLTRWDRYGDLSYGIYIIGWPLMVLATYFHLEDRGWFVYHAVVVVGVHIYAFLSWHLVERPALALKNWTPAWFSRLLERTSDRRGQLRERISRVAVFTPKAVR
ncbi:peptidoglycan/LPS O-acetylase OafA/YrhL [Microbacterium sp. AG790]|uniref:Acyltransferase n=1 Tax=Microbacterium hominis TaxID=162426 RepID=A0A0B4DZ74_9MICO|nr:MULTISPECIES: acyltransferase [Microbacterium]KIC59578.1 acyltransferase [Microbacterium hominis]RKS88606.1 peptidoglycan/LPS O-acetylase OafA/YrhL [Microbacterium sp. AG790]